MANSAERISPLYEIAMPRAADDEQGVELSERLPESLVQVQAWPDTVADVEKKLHALTSEIAIMSSGPGRWLIEDDAEGLEGKLRKQIGPKLGAVTSLTHGRVVVSVEGAKATWVLASGIALDFDLTAFAVGETRVSHFHEIGLTIHRTSETGFDLYVFTSLSRSFWQWLDRASAEVGYSVS